MKRLFKFYLLFFFIFFSFKTIPNDEDILAYKNKITLHYEALHQSSNVMLNNYSYLCSNNLENLNKTKTAFKSMLEKWTKVQHIRVGPINDFNHYSRIQFWPDKRSVINRQYIKIKKNPPKELFDPILLAEKSVALQGIPILERILYEEFQINNKKSDELFFCSYGIAVIKNLNIIFAYLYEAWKNNEYFYDYIDRSQLLSELFNSIIIQLEFISTHKIPNLNKLSYKKEEFWRSGYSITGIENNMKSIEYFYKNILKNRLKEKNYSYSKIEHLFEDIFLLIKELKSKNNSYIFIAENKKKIADVNRHLKILLKIFTIQISEILGLQIGFNKLDGD